MVTMLAGHDSVFTGAEQQRTRGDFWRPRVPTWGSSDSGWSDISAVSAETDISTSSCSTVKRRRDSPDVARSKSARRAAQPAMAVRDEEEDLDGELEEEDSDHAQKLRAATRDSTSSLITNYPHRQCGMELVILRQPESHHRARYQKEGSRGCIKDRTGNSCPTLQLKGIRTSSVLQIFVATESGKIRPHPLYRACRVGGKKCTPARDHFVDSVSVLELSISPDNGGFVNIDCLGILKLRNADLELFTEEDVTKRRRKREPKVRLVFRAFTSNAAGNSVALQVASAPICCTPSPGMPEIHRTSHNESGSLGGTELVIIGRNFSKDDSKVFVAEKTEDGVSLWESEVPLQTEHSHHVHVVGTIPPYRDFYITEPVEVCLIVKNKLKISEPYPFKYIPDESLARTGALSCATLDEKPAMSPVEAQRSSPVNSYQQSSTGGIEATWVAGDDSGNVFSYCIHPPGHQPFYITFPQAPESLTAMQVLVGSNSNPGPNSAYDVTQMRAFLDNGQNSRMPFVGHANVDHRTSEEDELFDQILRDILEPTRI